MNKSLLLHVRTAVTMVRDSPPTPARPCHRNGEWWSLYATAVGSAIDAALVNPCGSL
jgi:hypothetical protein